MATLIRHARSEDARALAELASSSFHDTFAAVNTPEDMAAYLESAFSLATTRRELRDRASTFLLAEGNGMLQGYAKLRRDSVEACVSGPQPVELQRIYTHSACKGMGVGSALLQASLELARDEGYRTLWLGVWEHNADAIGFYESRGFNTVGSHDFMLGSDRQTDIIMQLDLENSP